MPIVNFTSFASLHTAAGFMLDNLRDADFGLEWAGGVYAMHSGPCLECFISIKPWGALAGVEIQPIDAASRAVLSIPYKYTDEEEIAAFDYWVAALNGTFAFREPYSSLLTKLQLECEHYAATPKFRNKRRVYAMSGNYFLIFRFRDDTLEGFAINDIELITLNTKPDLSEIEDSEGEQCSECSGDISSEAGEDEAKNESVFFRLLGMFWEGPADGQLESCSEEFDRPPWPPADE